MCDCEIKSKEKTSSAYDKEGEGKTLSMTDKEDEESRNVKKVF